MRTMWWGGQGREVHETRCLWCETVTKTETEFYALSLAVTQNSSLTNALRNFRYVAARSRARVRFTHAVHCRSAASAAGQGQLSLKSREMLCCQQWCRCGADADMAGLIMDICFVSVS